MVGRFSQITISNVVMIYCASLILLNEYLLSFSTLLLSSLLPWHSLFLSFAVFSPPPVHLLQIGSLPHLCISFLSLTSHFTCIFILLLSFPSALMLCNFSISVPISLFHLFYLVLQLPCHLLLLLSLFLFSLFPPPSPYSTSSFHCQMLFICLFGLFIPFFASFPSPSCSSQPPISNLSWHFHVLMAEFQEDFHEHVLAGSKIKCFYLPIRDAQLI